MRHEASNTPSQPTDIERAYMWVEDFLRRADREDFGIRMIETVIEDQRSKISALMREIAARGGTYFKTTVELKDTRKHRALIVEMASDTRVLQSSDARILTWNDGGSISVVFIFATRENYDGFLDDFLPRMPSDALVIAGRTGSVEANP